MDTSRLPYVDSLKGFAMIVIVIVHHCISFIPDWLTSWMTSFFVDAFYIAVGWVYAVKAREFNVASTARKRLRQLGIPYLWFSLILFCITCLWVAVGHFETSAIPIAGFKVACLRGIGTLWFLPALFFSEIIFVYVMSRSFRKNVKLKRAVSSIVGSSVNNFRNRLPSAANLLRNRYPPQDFGSYNLSLLPWHHRLVNGYGRLCSRKVVEKQIRKLHHTDAKVPTRIEWNFNNYARYVVFPLWKSAIRHALESGDCHYTLRRNNDAVARPLSDIADGILSLLGTQLHHNDGDALHLHDRIIPVYQPDDYR